MLHNFVTRSRTYLEAGTPPLVGFVEYVHQGDGVYRAVQRPPVQMASLTHAAKATGKSRDIIYRLYKTGFIDGNQTSPGKIMVDLQSVQAHFRACEADPFFWTEERKAKYRGR